MSIKTISGLILVIVLTGACSKNDNVKISGSYPGGAGEYLQLEMLNITATQFIDSARISKKGTFKFTVELDNPELLLVKNNKDQHINVLAFPGDDITLSVNDTTFRSGYDIMGSEESEKIRGLVEKIEKTRMQLDPIVTALDALDDQEGPEADKLIAEYVRIFQEQKKSTIHFIVQNISSLSSVYALYQRISPDVYVLNDLKDLQYFKIVSDSVSVRYPGSTLVMSLMQDVKNRFDEYNTMIALNEISKTNQVETGLIDLMIEDDEGMERSLKALEGKVVLLNFWASWNSDSRDVNRQYMKTWEEYHSRGFEVYSVSLDSDRTRWKSAIYFEQYPWIDVCELTYPYSYAATIYNVTSIPANYLIDREGNVVAKNIPGNRLSTWLDNLL